MSLSLPRFAQKVSAIQLFALIFILQLAGWQLLAPAFVGNDEPWQVTRTWSAIRLDPLFGTPRMERPSPWFGGPLRAPAGIYGLSTQKGDAGNWRCFMHKKEIPATCPDYVWDDTTPTTDTHPFSDYPPTGYLWMGLPTLLLSGKAAYFSMRAMVFAAVCCPVLIALYAVRKNFSTPLLAALTLFIPPAVVFHATSVSIDGPIYGTVLATALLVTAALRDRLFLKDKVNFFLLAFFSTLAILLKITAAASIGALTLAAIMMEEPRVWRWVKWMLPSLFILLVLSVLYPFAFPTLQFAVTNGTPAFFSAFGGTVAALWTILSVTLEGDYQLGTVPLILGLPYGIWCVSTITLACRGLGEKQKWAVAAATFSFLLFICVSVFSVAHQWFTPWSARYSWPMMVGIMVLLLGLTREHVLRRLPLRFGFFVWGWFMAISVWIAYNRFYRGIVPGKANDWWQAAEGIVGKGDVIITAKLLLCFLLFFLSIVLTSWLVWRGTAPQKKNYSTLEETGEARPRGVH